MKHIILTLSLLFVFTTAQARIRYVDKTGTIPGSFTTIQAAVNAAIDGDTVRILPGSYPDPVTIPTNIVVQGAGALNTFIAVVSISSGAAVTMTSGKIEWVSITSSVAGLSITNAKAVNCVFSNCGTEGLLATGSNAVVVNCIATSNGDDGFYSSGTLTATNCISVLNKNYGYYEDQASLSARFCDGYGNHSNTNFAGYFGSLVQVSCLQVDPSLSSTYAIASNSQVAGAGDPLLLNLNGSPSDMGYYGGPDAPQFPYVTLPSNITLNADGTIQFDMVGKVGY